MALFWFLLTKYHCPLWAGPMYKQIKGQEKDKFQPKMTEVSVIFTDDWQHWYHQYTNVRRLCIAVSCEQPTSLSVAINHEVLPTLVEVTGLTPIKHCIFRRSPAWSVLNRALNECQYEDGHSRTQTWNGSTQQNIKLRKSLKYVWKGPGPLCKFGYNW